MNRPIIVRQSEVARYPWKWMVLKSPRTRALDWLV